MNSWTLHLPVAVRSANEIMRWLKHSKMKHRYGALRRAIGKAVMVEGSNVPKAEGKRRVRITRIMGPRQRAFDDDNIRMGGKAILDELVRFGLLVDDSPRWVSVEYAQERGAEAGARVEIWDDESEVA